LIIPTATANYTVTAVVLLESHFAFIADTLIGHFHGFLHTLLRNSFPIEFYYSQSRRQEDDLRMSFYCDALTQPTTNKATFGILTRKFLGPGICYNCSIIAVGSWTMKVSLIMQRSEPKTIKRKVPQNLRGEIDISPAS